MLATLHFLSIYFIYFIYIMSNTVGYFMMLMASNSLNKVAYSLAVLWSSAKSSDSVWQSRNVSIRSSFSARSVSTVRFAWVNAVLNSSSLSSRLETFLCHEPTLCSLATTKVDWLPCGCQHSKSVIKYFCACLELSVWCHSKLFQLCFAIWWSFALARCRQR